MVASRSRSLRMKTPWVCSVERGAQLRGKIAPGLEAVPAQCAQVHGRGRSRTLGERAARVIPDLERAAAGEAGGSEARFVDGGTEAGCHHDRMVLPGARAARQAARDRALVEPLRAGQEQQLGAAEHREPRVLGLQRIVADQHRQPAVRRVEHLDLRGTATLADRGLGGDHALAGRDDEARRGAGEALAPGQVQAEPRRHGCELRDRAAGCPGLIEASAARQTAEGQHRDAQIGIGCDQRALRRREPRDVAVGGLGAAAVDQQR